MGRHADPDPRHFYRSVAGTVARGALAVAVVAGIVALLAMVGRSPQDEQRVFLEEEASAPPVVETEDTTAEGGEAPPEPIEEASTVPTAEPTEEREEEPAEEPEDEATEEPDDPEADAPAPGDTTIQVLNGTGDEQRTSNAVATLEGLGYRIVAISATGFDYPQTEVHVTAGSEAAAEALRARDGRFAGIRPNRNLSQQVHLHVIVGRDWPR